MAELCRRPDQDPGNLILATKNCVKKLVLKFLDPGPVPDGGPVSNSNYLKIPEKNGRTNEKKFGSWTTLAVNSPRDLVLCYFDLLTPKLIVKMTVGTKPSMDVHGL